MGAVRVMATTHTCHVDCRLEVTPYTDGNGKPCERRAHIMYAAEPSSAAGRYQWEQNAAIKLQGRRAWRATGQGQSRACREWDHRRATTPDDYPTRYGILGRRLGRELAEMTD